MRTILSAALVLAGCVLPSAAGASDAPLPPLFPDAPVVYRVRFEAALPDTAVVPAPLVPFAVPALPALEQGATPPKAFVYSEGYEFRRKIHKYASLATGPLFVAQAIVGKKLYDGDTSSGMRSTHSALAAGVGVLFGVNTITGAWNLWEGRKDPNGRGKRILHSVLMLAADAAFLATSGNAPESEDGRVEGNRAEHRNMAIIGFSGASVGYLLMLLAR